MAGVHPRAGPEIVICYIVLFSYNVFSADGLWVRV